MASRNKCVNLLKILADETRLAVVHELMKKPKNVGDLNKVIRIDQSLLSHHLRVLRDSRLVTSRRSGKSVLYSVALSVLNKKERRSINLGCCQLHF